MSQSRAMSAIETALNIGSGYLIAVVTQAIIYPMYGIHTTVSENASIAVIFTVVSLIRSYAWRRFFA